MIRSTDTGALVGVEAVIDKDLASELLAEDVAADLFLMATDVDGVYLDWGKPGQRRLGQVTPEELASHQFPAGSMGPKVEAAARFAAKTGRRAAIGSLDDIAGIVAGTAGTNVVRSPDEHRLRPPSRLAGQAPVHPAGRIHRCRRHGRRGNLRPARRGRDGGRGGGLAVLLLAGAIAFLQGYSFANSVPATVGLAACSNTWPRGSATAISLGSAVALLIFTLITAAHFRVRGETGASVLVLGLAIAASAVVLLTFVFTTLIHEPASIVTLVAIVLLGIGLDFGWKRTRASQASQAQVSASAGEPG